MRRLLLIIAVLVAGGVSAAQAECVRCKSLTGRWCSDCTKGTLCSGCADRVWPRGSDNADFHRTPLGEKHRWEYGMRLSELQEELRTTLNVFETRNFRLISDIEHAKAHEVSNLCEKYYGDIRRTFQVGPTDKLFGGRCQIYCFTEYKTFRTFTGDVEEAKLVGCSGGFTVVRVFEPKIAVFTQGVRDDQFLRTMIHEMTHVVLGLYARDRRLKDWLQEGTAQYFEFQYRTNTSRAPEWQETVKNYLEEGTLTPAPELIDMEIAPIDHQGYVESWSLVTFMIGKGGGRFGRFIRALKNGTDQAQALKDSFGWTPEELSLKWKDYIRKQ